ncbi:phosphotransferase [Pedobacter sp. PAMC26386]|nr:phosphotransferase [Pedobacter sp. PAMC26386]
MIPEVKITAVKYAIHAAFGVSEFDAISELTGGLSSALVFRIVVRGKPYLLRIITRTDAMGDPTYQYARMKTAADAGLAPHVWYTSITDGISITDFVETKALKVEEAKVMFPDLLKRLHSLPPFPHKLNYLDTVDNFIRKFQTAKILADSMTSEIFCQYERIKNVYPRNSDNLVSCHNDLKPENILFDGDRLWLVDWEAAFLNDRYVDLAIVANFVVTDDEEDYLKRYFGEEVNAYDRACFFLMSQLVHLFYTAYLLLGSPVPIDLNSIKPDFREFHDRMWRGEITLANHDAWQQYAWVHLEKLLQNFRLKRFDDSLHIVSIS